MGIKKIALLASGAGSNAENIVRHFAGRAGWEVVLIVSNRADALVHERAKRLKIPSFTFPKEGFENGEVLRLLQRHEIDFIVLAGFLLKISEGLLRAFPNRIINIHPALLPRFGGRGMYGRHVHEAVVAQGETETGITIHYVNENYDEGQIIFQARCEVLRSDSPDDVAARVHELEYRYFPEIIEQAFAADF
jgi:phosphoribosylglycinamide formyltransferase-1